MTDILIYGDIGNFGWWDDEGITAETVARQLEAVPTTEKTVNIRINSVGGLTGDGIAIRNQMRSFANKRRVFNSDFALNAVVDGYAYSAASIIAMGGDKIIMNSGSMMMIHRAWAFTMGNAAELQGVMDYLAKTDQNIASLYASRSGRKETEMLALMDAETFFTADEAVAAKLADQVDETTIANYGKIGDSFLKVRSGGYEKAMQGRLSSRHSAARNRDTKPPLDLASMNAELSKLESSLVLDRLLHDTAA